MQYPDNFETPAFPAGRRIASSRAMSIAVSVVLLLIFFACGVLLWSAQSVWISPVLVSVNGEMDSWRIVGREGGRRKIPPMIMLQQSVIANFVKRRFYISGTMAENESLWRACAPDDCVTQGNTSTGTDCSLFCLGSPTLFADFSNMLVPDYRFRVAASQRWSVIPETIRIVPMGRPTDAGGMWRVQFSILSNVEPPIEIIAYARVARSMAEHPRTMGYYIADFNAYRMN